MSGRRASSKTGLPFRLGKPIRDSVMGYGFQGQDQWSMLLMIANDTPLGPEWLDRTLAGDWAHHREFHVGGDFLLIYRLERHSTSEKIFSVRADTYAKLFK